jgi:hypothetical protein
VVTLLTVTVTVTDSILAVPMSVTGRTRRSRLDSGRGTLVVQHLWQRIVRTLIIEPAVAKVDGPDQSSALRDRLTGDTVDTRGSVVASLLPCPRAST